MLETSTHAMWNIVVILSYIFAITHGFMHGLITIFFTRINFDIIYVPYSLITIFFAKI